MAVLSARECYKNLKKKGFLDAENRSDDHKYLEFYRNGKLILYTKISHGAKDIWEPFIRQMRVQCHLEKQQFLDLVRCPLSQEAYEQLLEEQDLFE